MNAWIARCLLPALLALAGPASAQLAQYGYVVGTLEPEKSFLEKLDEPDKGKFLHYHIFLKTAADVEYEAVIDVNDARVPAALEKIRAAVGGSLDRKTVALLGLTFKPNTDDLRESPAMAIRDGLTAAGAVVRAFDPVGMKIAALEERAGVTYGRDEYETARGADALVVATEWNQFRALDLDRIRAELKEPVIVDLRNVYDPLAMRARGFRYSCIGRS